MKRILSTLVVIWVLCCSAFAQSNPGAGTVVIPRPKASDAIPQLFTREQFSPPRIDTQTWLGLPDLAPEVPIVPQPGFVVKNSAVYYEMFGGLLIPLPGGGASGCFNERLRERIDNLRGTIESLRLLGPAPSRR
jgi:hypothetical protein